MARSLEAYLAISGRAKTIRRRLDELYRRVQVLEQRVLHLLGIILASKELASYLSRARDIYKRILLLKKRIDGIRREPDQDVVAIQPIVGEIGKQLDAVNWDLGIVVAEVTGKKISEKYRPHAPPPPEPPQQRVTRVTIEKDQPKKQKDEIKAVETEKETEKTTTPMRELKIRIETKPTAGEQVTLARWLKALPPAPPRREKTIETGIPRSPSPRKARYTREVREFADRLWGYIPSKLKQGEKKSWTYIQVLNLADMITRYSREAGIDPESIDWKHEIDWSQGYRVAVEKAKQLLLHSGSKRLTRKEIEEYAKYVERVQREVPPPPLPEPAMPEEQPQEWEQESWVYAKIPT